MWTMLRERIWTTPAIFMLVVGAILSVCGIAVLIDSSYAIGSQNWPTTEGVVLKSELTETGWDEDTYTYCPQVSYAYRVDGKSYVSDKIKVETPCNGHTVSARPRAFGRYPVGAPVQVYYDANNPALAVLEPGLPDPLLYLILAAAIPVGAVLLATGLLTMLGIVQYLPREKSWRYNGKAR